MTEVRHISVAIDRPWTAVYAFASDPRNLPLWAAGLGMGIEPAGPHWHVQTPDGPLVLRFAPANAWGVMDHTVVLSDGTEVYVPMRAVANGAGCQMEISLFRQPEMDDAAFDRDTVLVEADLLRLRDRLESRAD